jgi:anti-anti-sigma regulatory factor
LDYEQGGIYFNVLANGQPYALGTERGKGSHSMAGYHSFELCFLASVYINLLVNKQSMNFYFSPNPSGLKDRILRVSPDILPQGAISIEEVTIDGVKYDNFDAKNLTILLPDVNQKVAVKVRLAPQSLGLDIELISNENGQASYKLFGSIDKSTVSKLRNVLDKLSSVKKISLDFQKIENVSDEGWNYLAFANQMRGDDFTFELSSLSPAVKVTLDDSELTEEFEIK